jgi:hypothetical protein
MHVTALQRFQRKNFQTEGGALSSKNMLLCRSGVTVPADFESCWRHMLWVEQVQRSVPLVGEPTVQRRLSRHRIGEVYHSSFWNAAAVLVEFLTYHIDEQSGDADDPGEKGPKRIFLLLG